MLRYVVALCLLALAWAQDCQVANIQVVQNFDRSRVSQKYKIVYYIMIISIFTVRCKTVSLGFVKSFSERKLYSFEYFVLSLMMKNSDSVKWTDVDFPLIVCRSMVRCSKEGPRGFVLN